MCSVPGRIMYSYSRSGQKDMPKVTYWAKCIIDVYTVYCGDTEENLFQKLDSLHRGDDMFSLSWHLSGHW